MKILILNSGSSSIKYKVYDVEGDKYDDIASGVAERIGIDGSFIKHKPKGKEKVKKEIELKNHDVAIKNVFELLLDKDLGVMETIEEITGVGHRVVHGGEDFTSSVVVNDDVVKAIENNIPLAPLHNPANLLGIKAVEKTLPKVKQVCVFDTAVHQSMPAKAYLYGLPMEQYKTHKIRRYGFHGTSHGFVAKKAAEMMNKAIEDTKIVTCHIGNGGSLCAFDGGKSIDTSMGFTPLAGIIMGTRSGDMDPYIPLHIMKTQNLSIDDVNRMINKQGGMQGLAGHSDMREVEDGYLQGDKDNMLAFETYIYRIAKYIGSYIAALKGVDAIVFTAGVGENSPILREKVLEYFPYLGIEVDKQANNIRGKDALITTPKSKVKAFVIPTDEELVIAKDTVNLIG